jgi:outer membrane protein assembly factor BamB
LATGELAGQELSRVYTQPCLPSKAALDRLNLVLAWRAFVPTDTDRDGIYSMHLLGDDLVVQTRSGMVVMLDAETGATRWRTALGQPFRVTTSLGHNSRSIFAVSGIRLFSLDRATGIVQWSFTLPHAAAAAPAADENQLYLPLGNRRLYVYELPHMPPAPGTAREAALPSTTEAGALPNTRAYATPEQLAHSPLLFKWNYEVPGFLEQAPLLTATTAVIADTNGDVIGLPKGHNNEIFRFQARSPISAGLGQHGSTAYVASSNFDVYALDMLTGYPQWRFTADRLILRKPAVTDDDVYISPQQAGLFRVDRRTGRELWRNGDAERFLAHSRSYVYAVDRFGCMLVLDRARGTILSGLYVGEYVAPFSNDVNDRIYLAANNGLIICLRDRDLIKPLRFNLGEERPLARPNAPPAISPRAPETRE